MKTIKQFPHCDARILHAPNQCVFCDKHPDWQELREVWKINFTGERDPNKATCPAEVERSLDNIQRWGGNRPATEEDIRKMQEDMEALAEKFPSVFPKSIDKG